MYRDKLDSLELVVLQKRLDLLKGRGIVAKLPFKLGNDFLELMDDRWTFDGIISTIHGLQEQYEPSRDEAVGETLPGAKKKRGRKRKAELQEAELLTMELDFDED